MSEIGYTIRQFDRPNNRDRVEGARASETPREAATPVQIRRPALRSAAELQNRMFEPVRYVVPGYFAEGCTLFAGRPKLGKSWLMLDIGLAVAAGRSCLGQATPCEQGDVLYLALEDNERRLQRRIDRVLGIFLGDWPAAFEYATEWPRADEGGIELIREWIQSKVNPRLVIVDVLAMFKPVRGSRETLYEADYAAIKCLQALAAESGVAIVVVHHTRKGQGESDPFEKVSGTLGLTGAADATVILDRDGNGTTLYGRGRDVEEVEVAVQFDKDACRWTVLGEAAEVRRTDERGVILDVLKEADEPMGPGEIADAAHMKPLNVRQLLYKMVRSGEVMKLGVKSRYIHPSRTDLSSSAAPNNGDNAVTEGQDDGDDEYAPDGSDQRRVTPVTGVTGVGAESGTSWLAAKNDDLNLAGWNRA